MDWNNVVDIIVKKGAKVLLALVILFVCVRLLNALAKKLQKKLLRSDKLDKTTVKVLVYAGRILLEVLTALCLVSYVGFDTSGITALITSLGVCFGLAVNGALSNLAGGILLFITKPFKVDDYIEACGYDGIVEDIHIISTKLRTYDNKVVYIPNGTLSSEKIVNHFQKPVRRVDLQFDVDYSTDLNKAKAAARKAIENTAGVLSEPAPLVRVSEFKDSSVGIITKTWVKSEDYWDAIYDITENVKSEFDKVGISVPFNQLDVHIKKD